MDSGDRLSTYKIGDWVFVSESHELLRGEECVRLEHRAAALLQYLCARRGEVVSRESLITHVWGARHVSANSLPTAVHAIRRALGDDAKHPTYLQTVAKTGYRLIASEAPLLDPAIAAQTSEWDKRRMLALAAMIAGAFVALAMIGATIAAVSAPQPTTLILARLQNETGDPRYDVTARASESVLVEALGHYNAYRIRRGASQSSSDVQLSSKLVLWSGLPDVVVEARDARGLVLWSGFAYGAEPTLPQKLRLLVAQFATRPSTRSPSM